MFQKCKIFQKIPIGSGYNSRHKYAFSTKHAQKFHHPVVPQRMKKKSMTISPTSNWILLRLAFFDNNCSCSYYMKNHVEYLAPHHNPAAQLG